MFNPRLALASFIAGLGASVALACGPFFPSHLLENRARTLLAPPANSFAFEAAHLVPPPGDSLRAVEDVTLSYDESREKAEAQGLTDNQIALIRSMREAKTGDEAFARGAALPPALRLYTAGAVGLRAEDGDYDKALARFQAVLNLPEDDRRPRATWAAFVAARLSSAYEEAVRIDRVDQELIKTGARDPSNAVRAALELAQQKRDTEELSRAFALVRDLALQGAPDPLGLAVASYGEEAKLHLRLARAYLDERGMPGSPADIEKFRHEISAAVLLYAEQAARGSQSGVDSLRIIAQLLLRKPEELDADTRDTMTLDKTPFLSPAHLPIVLSDPRIERLLVAYVAALNEVYTNDDAGDRGPRHSWKEPSIRPGSSLAVLLDAMEQRGIDHSAAPDRLAALAYRVGRYDLAAKMAAMARGPLASWVKAKLALQKSDLDAAATFYAEAAKAFPTAQAMTALDDNSQKLLRGESGVLDLARGEYVDAMDKLYRSGSDHWSDAAYVAERVLTIDELRAFVDSTVPSPSPPPPPPTCDEDHDAGCGDNPTAVMVRRLARCGDATDVVVGCGASLRDLLARRLVREGRYEESLTYFQDPAVAAKAAAYGKAVREAKKGNDHIQRAQAWFAAAVLARRFGMEMMGSEGAPDFFIYDGELQEAFGSQAPDGDFVSSSELFRFNESASSPDARFHYRFIAADEAERAANLLPPRSQAFAAVLCWGAGWMRDRDERRARDLYDRYVDAGAYLPWAKDFGNHCPEPDFAAASGFEHRQFYRQAQHLIGQYRRPILGGAGVVLSLFLLAAWRWRVKRRQAVWHHRGGSHVNTTQP